MQIKSELRKTAREKRKNIENKSEKDEKVINFLLSLDEYKNAKTLLCYVSLDDEISTDYLIVKALKEKRVAVPFCRDKSGNMDFYIIDSLNELTEGSFKVREPDISKCEKLTDFSDSVIIVPGLVFNENGYRLGFGKGYYDRFLNNNHIFSIGLCFDELISDNVPIDEYDKNVDIIITQSRVIRCTDGGKNG